MEYSVGIPNWFLKKGSYTFRAEIYATNGLMKDGF